jgi:hypothetical protein
MLEGSSASLIKGRLLETILKAERGVALHCPGRPGKSPARHYDPAARSSLYGSGGTAGEGSAAPGEKSPRWSAERRASRVMERRAPRKCLAYRVMIRPAGASHAPERFSASAHPPIRGERSKVANPRAQKRAAGTRWLFDIVR